MEFRREQFDQLLDTRQFGRPLYWFDTLSSTNSVLWDLLDQGAGSGTAVIAAQQQSGRGQWGHQWQSLPGGLYLSLAVVFEPPPATEPNLSAPSQLTFCSAWGIATTLRSYSVPVRLKWPNDILLCGRKLGGILTETHIHRGHVTTAVIGVGINWVNPVPESGINLHLASQPHPSIHSLEMLAAITLKGLEAGYQRWQSGIDLLPDYLKLLTHVGDTVQVGDQLGTIVGVSPTGDLRVRLDLAPSPDSEICLSPGTISLGYPGR